ncbi:MAG: YchE family NAAT transporter [Proteobacteria bacterium]|nr:YchE family NAAT transporter [Pseudomonadota bacterium]MBU1061058.1 YchE family NAAT transporter [Pseudomonadota bacterium]
MDVGNVSEYLKFFATMTAIVNPIGAIPIFINLTADNSKEQRRKNAIQASYATAAILLMALFSGERLLVFFGISIASFRVGGGILILLMAISMLHAKVSSVKHTDEEAQDSVERETVAVVPLGTPLLAGPGAIGTVILYGQRYESALHYGILAIIIIVLALAVLLSFRTAPLIASYLGKTGINVITRIMGLIMAAVGVEFIANGLKQLFPILA